MDVDEEKRILGVSTRTEATNLRDAVMLLVGRFDEHSRALALWQSRIEKELEQLPKVMDKKLEAHVCATQEDLKFAKDFAVQRKNYEGFFLGGARGFAAVVSTAAAVSGIILAIAHFL